MINMMLVSKSLPKLECEDSYEISLITDSLCYVTSDDLPYLLEQAVAILMGIAD